VTYSINNALEATVTSAIAEVQSWISDRVFPPDSPLLDVSQAVPSYPPATELREHLAQVVLRNDVSVYTEIGGLVVLRQALAEHFNEQYGGGIDPSQVTITTGCNQAFCVAISGLAQSGDEVILSLPYYFNHHMWLTMNGLRPVLLPSEEGQFPYPDPDQACSSITSRTRAIVLISPNNPTGAIYPSGLIDAFFELAREHGLALILDETYKDFRCASGPPHGLFQRSDWQQTLVQLYSFSKGYSLAGYRVGSLICGHALKNQIEKVLDCATICPSRIGQEAAWFGLRNLGGWRDAKARLMSERLKILESAVEDGQSGYEIASAGAYFAYLRHPFANETSLSVARRLADRHNVLCVPGGLFGPRQERYLRFAFANLDASQIPPLVQRLRDSEE
jgi:hypothetical protein